MIQVGSKVSHRFHPLYHNSIGKVISLKGHQFDGHQMVVVDWGVSKQSMYPIQHHHAEALRKEV